MITDIPPAVADRSKESFIKELLRLCRGDKEAVEWCMLHEKYAHALDDMVDQDKGYDPNEFALLCMCLYSHRFYQRNSAVLSTVMRLAHNNWLDANEWEKSDKPWQQLEADTLRHCGADVIRVVIDLCGGWDAMREISPVLRIIAYDDHHDEQGKPH